MRVLIPSLDLAGAEDAATRGVLPHCAGSSNRLGFCSVVQGYRNFVWGSPLASMAGLVRLGNGDSANITGIGDGRI